MTIFCERLNELIRLQKVTQEKLAEITGLQQQTMSRYIRGERLPRIDTLEKLCIYFEVSADYFIGLENEDGSKNY